jgi:hypothetical protein
MCVLLVTGTKFDPAKYLASSRLKPYSVFRAGEPRFPGSKAKDKVHEVSGFKIDVSRGSWDSLVGQVVDAIAFLKKHRLALAKLRSIPEVEDIRLDFPLDLRIDRKHVFAQFDYFPPELVSLAGAIDYPRDFEQLARSRQKSSRKRSATRRRKRR